MRCHHLLQLNVFVLVQLLVCNNCFAQECEKWNISKMVTSWDYLTRIDSMTALDYRIDDFSDFSIHSTLNTKNCSRRVTIENHLGIDTNLRIQDGKIPHIREAKNRLGIWKPIEYWPTAWCGQSYRHTYLKKGNSISFNIQEYTGRFKTNIRIRVHINGKDYFSAPYTGRINYGQFKRTKTIRIKRKKGLLLFK